MCSLTGLDDLSESCRLFDFVICAIVIGIISFSGIIGNVTSFYVLLKHRTETSAIFLLQCMAVSDSVLLVLTLFIYSFPAIYPYTGELFVLYDDCNYVKYYIWPVAMMTHTATIWLTVLVTINRFSAICRPIGAIQKQGTDAVKLQVSGVILFSIIYNLPRFFEHQPLRIDYHNTSHSNDSSENISYSRFNLGDSKIYQIIYSNVLYFPVMYIAPLLILSYLNVRLIRCLNAIKEKKETLTGHKPKEDHITICIIVIVCVFILCQTPALVNQIFWASLDYTGRQCGHFHFYYTKLSDALVVLNSSCNFVIYCLFGKSFRKIFLDTLCMERRRAKNDTCLNEIDASNGGTMTRTRCRETCFTDAV